MRVRVVLGRTVRTVRNRDELQSLRLQSLRSRQSPRRTFGSFMLDLDGQLLMLSNDPLEWQSHNASHEMPVRFSDAADDKIVP